MGRTLAIGDIHGCSSALDTLLAAVAPTGDDKIVFLGDYVDRGPDTKGVLDRVIALHEAGRAICIRGNHEIMMASARRGHREMSFWLHCGGDEALESYATAHSGARIKIVPDKHWEFIEQITRPWFETETHVFVHANLHPGLPLEQQTEDWLHWQVLDPQFHAPHISGKTMLCGHTEQRNGSPLVLQRAICIDTWAYADGWLTCLDVESQIYWQANELGSVRRGKLANPKT